ncbi:HAD family hydrolase [Myroides sp. JBRI-B21084]|uniref:HAD family hydrolase n=1 Tax=Myroides sp. JBRI-B21084 TaxID=3119977 RepID=UPI0026E1FE62|nr:HAD family hydrolase [Paenimyroides cloacae]WKW46896.1 HAD family hydrolase [Paenimyroides cloacae]
MNEENKILLILDIDETLIHASEKKLDREPDFVIFDYCIYERPFLFEFLNEIKEDFLVAVWSSASDDYVEKIVEKIFPQDYKLEFIWGRSRCTTTNESLFDEYGNYSDYYIQHFNHTKPLKKVKKKGFDLERILIIDDTPNKSKKNYGNAIYPKEFTGDSTDNELKTLAIYLKSLKNEKNVRIIEKRGWNEKKIL